MLCDKCGKVFSLKSNLMRHLRNEHGPSKASSTCPICFKAYSRLDNLYRHIETHKQTAAPKRKASPYTEDQLAAAKKYPKADMRQSLLTPDSLPTEDPTTPINTDPLIVRNWHHIRTHYHISGNVQHRYNFRLPVADMNNTIKKNLQCVFDSQKWKAKWNVSFGFVLTNAVTNEEGYYYASTNTRFFDRPITVRRFDDMVNLLERFDDIDVEEWARQKRPNSKFVVERITNMTVTVNKLSNHALIGCPVDIPSYIKYNMSIVAFDKDHYGRAYKDNLCFFRCMALHHGKHHKKKPTEFEAHAKELCNRWCEHKQLDKFDGVDIDNLYEMEEFFGVNIAIYELEEVKKEESDLQRLMREADERIPEFQPPALMHQEDTSDDELMPENDSDDPTEEDGAISKGLGAMFLNDMAEESDEDEPMAKKAKANPERSETPQIADLPPLPIPTLLHISGNKHNNTLNLNLYNNHFSYISNIERYSKSWTCPTCKKLWNHHGSFERHVRNCEGTGQEIVYKGGGFGLPKSIHDELREEGLPIPPGDIYPFRITYDFEARFEDNSHDPLPKLSYTKRLIPASVSLASNVPDYQDPVCFVGEPLDIIQAMHAYLNEVSEVAFALMKDKYGDAYEILREKTEENKMYQKQLSKLLKLHKTSGGLEKEINEARGKVYETRKWSTYLFKFDTWIKQIVVLGFNSAKFDLNLIKQYYIPFLVRSGEKVTNAIMKNNAFMSLATQSFIFLDITNYLSPGTSYEKFLKAFKVDNSKGAFPYEWFKDLSQLEQTWLPSREEFYSTLRQKEMNTGDYEDLQKVWVAEGFKNMKDLLVWYNNKDVVPFLEAVQKMFDQFEEWGIDMFKQAISLPGVAMRRMMQKLPKGGLFPLFNEKWKNIHTMIKDNIVGGPAIVFHRYHEVGKTTIRGDKTVNKILGYDANSLYLWALCQDMPTGLFAAWQPQDGNTGEQVPTESSGGTVQEERKLFLDAITRNGKTKMKATKSYTHCAEELFYLEYQRRELVKRLDNPDVVIQQRFNGGQKKFQHGTSSYFVDGYVAPRKFGNDKAIIFEFDGCYWHGCECQPTDRRDRDYYRRKENTKKKHEYLKSLGCEVIITKECHFDRLMGEIYEEDEWAEWEALHAKSGIKDKNNTTSHDIINAIMQDKVFGIAEVDIQVPHWNKTARDFWEELPPIFKNVELSRDDIGDFMKSHGEKVNVMNKPRRYLISSYFGNKILLATPMIKFLTTKCGLRVTRLHQFIEFQRVAAFEHLGEEVADQRRKADKDDNEKIKGEMYKLIGNNYYGRLLMDKMRFEMVSFACGADTSKYVGDKLFKKMDEINDDVYQIHMAQKKVVWDLPNIIPFFVYQYAKQRMLEFYNFLLRSLGKSNFQLIQMDTDSFYFAVADEDLASMIPDQRARQSFISRMPQFMAYDDYTQRTPGLFKLEWSGDGMIALNSKTYFGWKEEGGQKVSTKGLSKVTNTMTKDDFMGVLDTKESCGGTNHGFRLKNSAMMQYEQYKDSLTYFYPKRIVQNDGVSTKPLLL